MKTDFSSSIPPIGLEEVFKKAGTPTYTFVEPHEYNKVLVALRTPGRGVIIEGPSGIGKTSCIRRALDRLQMTASCTFLSARKVLDLPRIKKIATDTNVGLVIIDDFHRLDDGTKYALTDLVKVVSDEEDPTSKIVLIGINRAGQSLIDYAADLLHRVEVIQFGRTSIERITELINRGEDTLNCKISVAEEIAKEAEGSFAMAQVLCHEACLQAGLIEKADEKRDVIVSLPALRESVLKELTPRFHPVAREFATGNRLRREGRAPYLHLLKWLSMSPEGDLDTREAIAANAELKGSVSQVIDKGHLATLIESSDGIKDLIHFDSQSHLLTTEDPKFLYFIRNLIWSKFARQVGYFSLEFAGRYDFALSFAGEDRAIADLLCKKLTERELQVFYDINEQHRILANDVEEYLAPIYRTEARFVLALISPNYPRKIWTKFESDQFKSRFGENAVIPIYLDPVRPTQFDTTSNIGFLTINPSGDLDAQVDGIVSVLVKKIEEERMSDRKLDAEVT